MNIGLTSAKLINNDIDFNLNNCIRFIQEAKEYNADLIIFGEAYLQGFESLVWKPEIDLAIGIKRQSERMNVLRNCCKQKNIALGIGYIEREDNKLYSSYLVIDKNGNDIANYRRMSTGWRIENADIKTYKEGTEFCTFEFMGYKMTVGLCGDFWTNEIIKKILKDNIDIVLWPVFVSWDNKKMGTAEFNEYIEQSKKINKNVFYVNSICEGKKYLAYGGAFAVINNEVKAFLDQEKEDILVINY
jgi:N-carbamoylputrescine amidase